MVIFHKYLRESTEPVKHDLIASQARCTCSMQGEKEHRTPSCFSIKLTDGTLCYTDTGTGIGYDTYRIRGYALSQKKH